MWQVKYEQFYHVFHEKIVKVKGKQAKVGFLAWTWANFDGFLSSCNFEALKLLSRKTRAKFVKMFKTRKKFVKYELVRQQELEFDVDFRVNSSESFNHEKFSISFQFDEFFRILNFRPVKIDPKFANFVGFLVKLQFWSFRSRKTRENVQNSSISPVSPVSPFLYSYFDMVSRYVVHNRVVWWQFYLDILFGHFHDFVLKTPGNGLFEFCKENEKIYLVKSDYFRVS